MSTTQEEGTYERKQLKSRSRLISWSHATRFQVGIEWGGELRGKRVLDYGCGDGTYLRMLMESGGAPAAALGVDLSLDLVESNRRRFAGQRGLDFAPVGDLAKPEYAGAFDGLVCMEVLEHVLDPVWFVEEFHRLLAPGGLLLLSVPVEIGLAVVVKQAVRRVNGWRGIGDYPGTTSYTLPELARAVFAGPRQHVVRPIHRNPDGSQFHDHKGFNWRLLREQLGGRFTVEELRTSPVSWLPAFVASQVWFRARRK